MRVCCACVHERMHVMCINMCIHERQDTQLPTRGKTPIEMHDNRSGYVRCILEWVYAGFFLLSEV